MTRSAGQGASSAPHGAPCSLPYASSHAGPRQDRSRTPSPQGKLRHGATPPSPLKFAADASPPAGSCHLRHLLVDPATLRCCAVTLEHEDDQHRLPPLLPLRVRRLQQHPAVKPRSSPP